MTSAVDPVLVLVLLLNFLALGTSRLHAVIKRNGERITIMDLGSSNGTYVNGKRLTANAEQVLHHGDVVTFGKLKIQILLRN